MKSLIHIFSFSALLALTACSSSSDAPLPRAPEPEAPDTFKVQVLHASPDAPEVDVSLAGPDPVSGGDLSNIDYKVGTRAIELEVGSYDVTVNGQTPAGPVEVISETLPFAADTLYSIVAVGDVTSIQPVVLEQPASPPADGTVRLRVLHAAPMAPTVDVYATMPGADLAASAPVGTFSFLGDLGPIEVMPGDYQIRVTAEGDPEAVVFDSGTVPLSSTNDLLIAAVENTSIGPAPISLVVLNGSGSAEIYDKATDAHVRVVHASPDTPPVDVVVDDNFDEPLVPGLTYPEVVGYVPVTPGDYNIKVVEPDSGLTPIDEDVTFAAGSYYTVMATGTLAGDDIIPVIAADHPRPVATDARVRLIHGSPTASNVDIWITAPDADITVEAPTLTDIPLGANTGFLSVAAGTYEVNVAPTGTTEAALTATIEVETSGVYTAIARDAAGGGLPLGLILLDDFAAL